MFNIIQHKAADKLFCISKTTIQKNCADDRLHGISNRDESIGRELAEKEESRLAYEQEKKELEKKQSQMEERLKASQEELSEAAIRADSLEQAIADGKTELIDALNEKSGLSVKKLSI